MIPNDEAFHQTLEWMVKFYTMANKVKHNHPEVSLEWLHIFREGFIDQARQLQQQIEEYLEVHQGEESHKVNGVADAAGDGSESQAEGETKRAAS